MLRELRRFLRSRGADLESAPTGLADLLDAFVESFGEEASACATVRDALDATLPGVLAPGNCVEFRDGVHKAVVLSTALPDSWSGIVELSVCHSMGLALALRAGRQDRRVITNEKRKFLDRVVPELRETWLRLAGMPSAYVPLRACVAHAYGSSILEAAQ